MLAKLLTLSCGVSCAFLLAGCATTSTTATGGTLNPQSIAQKFAAFNKNGWSVTGGGIQQPQRVAYQRLPQNAVYPKGDNPFSHPIWSTNFHVDGSGGAMTPQTSGASNVVTPPSGGIFGGSLFPSTASKVVGQTGQSSVSR